MASYVIPPAGVSAASFFDPVAFADPASPPRILADDIDPATGELRSLLTSGHPVHTAIAYDFRTRFSSGAAAIGRGHRLREIRKANTGARAEIQQEIERVFRPYVEAGLISVLRIVVALEGDGAGAFGEYELVETGETRKAQVSL